MAIARAKLVDLTVTRWYHCVSRCVRKAFLLGEGDQNRKEWLEDRLEELSEIFAVAVGGFSVMDNHLHVLLRLDPEVAHRWRTGAPVERTRIADLHACVTDRQAGMDKQACKDRH
jgi:putative transposase